MFKPEVGAGTAAPAVGIGGADVREGGGDVEVYDDDAAGGLEHE